MAAVDSLRTHLVDELADLLDAEQQLTRALPKLARAATLKPLKTAFGKHLKETRQHVTRVKSALRELGEPVASKTCKGMQGLLAEGESMMKDAPAGALRDAVLITGAQKVEHYEMASYGTVRTYAQVLGETAVARLLQRTLDEEKAADLTLTQIAEKSVNEDAAEEWQARDDEGILSRTAEWARSAAATVGLSGSRAQSPAGRTRGRASARRTSKKR